VAPRGARSAGAGVRRKASLIVEPDRWALDDAGTWNGRTSGSACQAVRLRTRGAMGGLE
jgi:hypothetical protein